MADILASETNGVNPCEFKSRLEHQIDTKLGLLKNYNGSSFNIQKFMVEYL